jgi:CheY-like chemotaxis protein
LRCFIENRKSATDKKVHLAKIPDTDRTYAMPKEKLNILLIDDDRDECSFFREAMEKININFELTCCYNVMDEVYFHLLEKDFHLIFLDINMPGDNGITFLKKIKSKEQFKHIPIVMYTVSGNETDIEVCYNLDAFHYLVKPYSELNLIESLRKIFRTDFNTPPSKLPIDNFVINLAFA